MSKPQQWRIVPSPEWVRDGIADLVADTWQMRKHSLGEIEAGIRSIEIRMDAAPPPPEHVLTEAQIEALLRQYAVPWAQQDIIEQLIRDAERAVLQNLGAKNA